MSVYVDNVYIPARVGRLNAKWCHMMADSPEELHAFAQSIGLKRSWAQHEEDPTHLHYDVVESARARAVAAGAIEISWRDIGRFMRFQRRMLSKKPRYPSGRLLGTANRFTPKENPNDD